MLPQRPAPGVTSRALKELEERQAKHVRRQSRRTARISSTTRPLTLAGLQATRVTSQLTSGTIAGSPEISTRPPDTTSPHVLAETTSVDAVRSNVGNGDRAFRLMSPCATSDVSACDAEADIILLMRDHANRGMSAWLDTDIPSANAATTEEDALSETSELTDLDELERIMGISDAGPKSGKKRKWDQMDADQRRVHSILGLNRTACKLVAKAQSANRTVVFSHFSLEDAVKNPSTREAQGDFLFYTGDCPRRAVSGDGYDLVFHFPGALRGKVLDDLNQGAARWASVAPITANSKHDFTDCYRDGTFVGQTQMCQFWHSPGHHKDDAIVSRHIRQTGPSFRGTFRAMKEFSVVATFCSTLLKTIDPVQHQLLWQFRDRRYKRFEEQRIFEPYGPTLLWECCEVVYNRWSPPHPDGGDPSYAWACIVYFGTFRNAWFNFPQLGLKVCIRPGDVVFFRSKDLIHAVPDWGDGERNFLIYFTHESAWKNVGMGGRCASAKTHVPLGSSRCRFNVK